MTLLPVDNVEVKEPHSQVQLLHNVQVVVLEGTVQVAGVLPGAGVVGPGEGHRVEGQGAEGWVSVAGKKSLIIGRDIVARHF